MSTDLDELFESARDDATRLALVPPASLRRAGDRRGMLRRSTILVTAAAVVSIGAVAIAQHSTGAARRPAGGRVDPSASALVAITNTRPAACAPGDLTVLAPEFSASTLNTSVVFELVRNSGPVTCSLNSLPTLLYVYRSVVMRPVPVTDDGVSTVTVTPGQEAQFRILTHLTGCPYPIDYPGVTLQWGDGSRSSLRLSPTVPLTLERTCGDVDVIGWSRPS